MEFTHMSKSQYESSNIVDKHSLITYCDDLNIEGKNIYSQICVENDDVDYVGRNQDYGKAEVLYIGKQIVKFTESIINKVEKTYIVCNAGISRSVGTKNALDFIYNNVDNKSNLMNHQIYFSVLKEAGYYVDFEKEKENYRLLYPNYNEKREDLKELTVSQILNMEL